MTAASRVVGAFRMLRKHTRNWSSLRRAFGFARDLLSDQGIRGLRDALRVALHRASSHAHDYGRWVQTYDTFGKSDFDAMRAQIEAFDDMPLVSLVMPVFNPPEVSLREAIQSVIDQIYSNWELCIADDASTAPRVRQVLEEFAQRDPRIKVTYREENGHISRASNSALDLATGDWIALLDHDDLLPAHALYCVVETILANPQAQLIFSDEDKIDEEGNRFDPYFKSDWDPLLLCGHNMFSHLGVYRRDLVSAVGGFRTGFEGAQDYDLILRCSERVDRAAILHIPRVLYHWRAIAGSTARGPREKDYATSAALRALTEHFSRTGQAASVEEIGNRGMTRVRFALPDPAPPVSIIIPTRNRRDLLECCVDSILARTDYPDFEIVIVDNGSNETDTLAYLDQLAAQNGIRVIQYDGDFNFSAINNFAVGQVTSELICLLNNDTEVISPAWLSEMVALAIQPDAGVVGAKLLYPDETIQHAGVVMGLGGHAGHIHLGHPASSPGAAGRLELAHEVSVVTAACCVVRRSIYENLGGLDEMDFKVAYNDVDFCLRVREAGFHNSWTPEAVLYHHESRTRGYDTAPENRERFEREQNELRRRWRAWIERDPAYNPNLGLDGADASFACPPRVSLPGHFSPNDERRQLRLMPAGQNGPRLFFMHIPKTAGSSINHAFHDAFGGRALSHIEGKTLSNNELRDSRFVSGHVHFPEFKRISEGIAFNSITFLRDPIDQLRSHLNWVRLQTIEPRHRAFIEKREAIRLLSDDLRNVDLQDPDDIRTYLTRNEGNPISLALFENCQTRYFLPAPISRFLTDEDLSEAEEALEQFEFVGLTECFGRSIALLSQRYSLSLPTGDIRKNAMNYGKHIDRERFRDVLWDYLKYDLALYGLAKDRFSNRH
ncbi:glycosyltransferase [Cucumibacter marinus]|uniref:glycosyltransferase n=1 Tax=Cucumibacter marinus TaxID=1121252 RepID=UPI0012DFA5CA|nr:glycosyltransferase [Cucumibacter marinus]